MLNYTELLQTTYADMATKLEGEGFDFTFTIHNPNWEGGDAVVSCVQGCLTLSFATMRESFDDAFGDMVALIDELVHDESMIFEVYAHGQDVLGGSRGTDEIDIDGSLRSFVRSLCEGDPALHAELKAIIQEGACYCKLRGWRKERNRSILLS